jgi:hypothetical protein
MDHQVQAVQLQQEQVLVALDLAARPQVQVVVEVAVYLRLTMHKMAVTEALFTTSVF